jgi:hypothetical protein
MHAKQFASLIVMVLYLDGCTSWQVQPVAPQQLVDTDRPSKVRVLTKHHQKLVFEQPFVRNDSLLGNVDGKAMRIALDKIAQVEKRHTDTGKNVMLGVGIVGLFAMAVAYHNAMSNWERDTRW